MDYDAKHYRYFDLRCSRCGKPVKGWISIPEAKKPFYEKENHECLECGYVYFRHDRQLPAEQAAKLRAELGEAYATAQCSRCGGTVYCHSRRIDTPSKKEIFRSQIDHVCEQCHFWHTESTAQQTEDFRNQQRGGEGLPPLPHQDGYPFTL